LLVIPFTSTDDIWSKANPAPIYENINDGTTGSISVHATSQITNTHRFLDGWNLQPCTNTVLLSQILGGC
jgi:hypothetical protein